MESLDHSFKSKNRTIATEDGCTTRKMHQNDGLLGGFYAKTERGLGKMLEKLVRRKVVFVVVCEVENERESREG